MRRIVLVRVAIPMALASTPLAGQRDSARALTTLEPITIAERRESPLRLSTASVTRLTAADLATMPHASLADLLRLAPGFATVDGNGGRTSPFLMVRGFYGGGEADYVQMQIDGRPVNRAVTGLIAWDALPPLDRIASIEILRGGASSLYGDAAIGGVINVVTRRDGAGTGYAAVDAGSDRELGGGFGAGFAGWRAIDLHGSFRASKGFRDHSALRTGTVGFESGITRGNQVLPALRAHMTSTFRAFDEPGPLPASLAADDRGQSDVIFKFDHTSEREHRAWLEMAPESPQPYRTSLGFTYRRTAGIQTVAFAPGVGSSVERINATYGIDFRASIDGTTFGARGLQLGLDFLSSKYRIDYFQAAEGDRGVYQTTRTPGHAEIGRRGGARTNGALHGQYTWQPEWWLVISAGARVDGVRDMLSQGDLQASHTVVSPRLGLNAAYADGPVHQGNAYLSAGRSFKTPTPDQLYAGRFPGLSNPDLSPQDGVTLEAGAYHTLLLGGDRSRPGTTLSLTASAYTMTMRDEIDFDLATVTYRNIGRSLHRGIEAGATLRLAGGVGAFANATVQHATARSGINDGKRLKAIPGRSLNAGASWTGPTGRSIGVVVAHTGESWLDDANTRTLPSHVTVDLQGALPLRGSGIMLTAQIRNILGRMFNSGGYPDPAGSDEIYWYPGAGRAAVVGIKRGW